MMPADSVAADLTGLRIVIANWRDPWHPEAGGAERYAWEMATGLVTRGARVRFLTARGPGQSAGEHRDGIEIIRRGGRLTVYPRVLGWLLAHRWSVDVVLDCQNGIPFFTPQVLPRRVPVLCVLHHVHTEQFGLHFPGWAARIGQFLEGPAARFAYRNHACVAVSPSTVTAMRDRLRWTGDIYLIPNGTPLPPDPDPDPAPDRGPASADAAGHGSRLVWIGRLVAHKRAELMVPVAARGFTIDVIGRGRGEDSLRGAISAAGLSGAVHLHGYLSEEAKAALVAGSLLHLNTSRGEGWGLVVLEAAALGVPTVAYDVEGLRDAVRDGETGWLVKDGEELADVVERAAKELADPVRRATVAAACRTWAAQLSWACSTARMARLIDACVRRGSARGKRAGAWVVSAADGRVAVAEGPLLDLLLDAGHGIVRQATAAERLLGELLADPAANRTETAVSETETGLPEDRTAVPSTETRLP
jgi:glycosyltransferase involved in cell wall biosynthesis